MGEKTQACQPEVEKCLRQTLHTTTEVCPKISTNNCEVRWLIKNGFSYLDFWCMRSALVIFMYEFNQEKEI